MSYISNKRIEGRGQIGADILIVGTAPTFTSEREGSPIAQEHYDVLQKAIPILLSNVRIMNLCEYAPANNDYSYLGGSPQLQSGIKVLKSYIEQFPPKLIILLGEYPLNILLDKYNINDWNGSPLEYNGIKVVPTFHPSQWGTYTSMAYDIEKAIEYMNDKHTKYNLDFNISSDPMQQLIWAEEILKSENVTIDIETRRETMDLLCCGFGVSKEKAYCFVVHSEQSKTIIADLIKAIKNPIYHNSSFDCSVLRFFHAMEIPDPFFDTMIAQHVLQPELPKGLDYLCKIYTWHPCYWSKVKAGDEKTWNKTTDSLYVYNCYDCVVTWEAWSKMKDEFSLDQRRIFDHEMELLPPIMNMSETGFYVDKDRMDFLASEVTKKKMEDYTVLFALTEKKVLVSSPKQVQEYIYGDLRLPERKKRGGGTTSDEGALVNLINYCKTERSKLATDAARLRWDKKIAILKLMLSIREWDKLLSSYLTVNISPDGKLRSALKVSGTESGRLAAQAWYDKTGINAQTLPRKKIEVEGQKYPIRSFLVASKGNTLLSFDFSQAESWVVAYLANCFAMKDALHNGDIHTITSKFLFSVNEVDPEQRYIGKKFNHSSNYGTTPPMIAHMINLDSVNPPYTTISLPQAIKFHNKWKELYFEVPRWWADIKHTLALTRTLRTPYGRTRVFYGQWGDSLFKEAYSYIPQSTVADHCLGAVQPELGIEGGIKTIHKTLSKYPEINLLNTSHDSLILEVPAGMEMEIGEICINLLRRPLLINDETFTIPVDFEIGERWGELEKNDLPTKV